MKVGNKLEEILDLNNKKSQYLSEFIDILSTRKSYLSKILKVINTAGPPPQDMYHISQLPGIGPVYIEHLSRAGITFFDTLVEEDIENISRLSHITERVLFQWKCIAKLSFLDSLDVKLASELVNKGFFSIRHIFNKISSLKTIHDHITSDKIDEIIREADVYRNSIFVIQDVSKRVFNKIYNCANIFTLQKLIITATDKISEMTAYQRDYISSLKKQAELLLVEDMSPEIAYLLVSSGIDSIRSFINTDARQLWMLMEKKIVVLKQRPKNILPSLNQIEEWQRYAKNNLYL